MEQPCPCPQGTANLANLAIQPNYIKTAIQIVSGTRFWNFYCHSNMGTKWDFICSDQKIKKCIYVHLGQLFRKKVVPEKVYRFFWVTGTSNTCCCGNSSVIFHLSAWQETSRPSRKICFFYVLLKRCMYNTWKKAWQRFAQLTYLHTCCKVILAAHYNHFLNWHGEFVSKHWSIYTC